jgi:hypothetical protein
MKPAGAAFEASRRSTSIRKLELKMDVGQSNQMAVRVDGG